MTLALVLALAEVVAIEPPTPRTATYGALAAAGLAMSFDQIPVYAGGVGLTIGGELPSTRWSLEASYLAGDTEHGLGVNIVQVGLALEGRIQRFALGLGFLTQEVAVSRSSGGHALGAFGAGAELRSTFDIVQSERSALFASLRPFYTSVGPGSTWGASLFVGFRFR